MTNYDLFAKHYDIVMGDSKSRIDFVKKAIQEHKKDASKILELACGTGTILKSLEKKYQVYGLDLSSNMLTVAKKKVKSGKFFRQDMTKFKIDEKFDVILCIFDSINHLLKFSQWQQVFSKVKNHLTGGGVFIFDVNTPSDLKRKISQPPLTYWFNKNKNSIVINVVDAGNKIANWDISVFEHKKGVRYELYRENIKEVAFSIEKIKRTLQKYFSSVKTTYIKRGQKTQGAKRLFFICRK